MTASLPAGLEPFHGEYGYLNPMMAAGAMAFSSVSVMLNSLRLRGFRLVAGPAISWKASPGCSFNLGD